MKKSFTLAALLLVLSTGLFASAPAKTVADGDANSAIVFQAMRTALGFGVTINNPTATKSFVTITDNNNHVILLDKLGKGKSIEKAYNLSELENGTYTVTVTANNSTVTKKMNVYEEYGNKAYLFLQ
ncbi:T9SS type A sorting domain-containing protein [Mucilaginibacter terrigena]|uniref:T9SS type A sorting domain-containing protein n=1 Tax=Mucilaginibacter terrigena TaxID=2492395 RepID=A0A4Q5LL18_9SPHI|nr:T9SS type A sorting domain-containing protein [Mucilaginibacter terrigena]RYU90308.1 T9SS type A sorting domain-containing protein [Mucilaginibacter terrigena]